MHLKPRISLSVEDKNKWTPKPRSLRRHTGLKKLGPEILAELHDLVNCFGICDEVQENRPPYKYISGILPQAMSVSFVVNNSPNLYVLAGNGYDIHEMLRVKLCSQGSVDWNEAITIDCAIAFIHEVDKWASRLHAICPFSGRRINLALYDQPRLCVDDVFRSPGVFLPIPSSSIIERHCHNQWVAPEIVARFDDPEELEIFRGDKCPIIGICRTRDEILIRNRYAVLNTALRMFKIDPQDANSWYEVQVNNNFRNLVESSYKKLRLN